MSIEAQGYETYVQVTLVSDLHSALVNHLPVAFTVILTAGRAIAQAVSRRLPTMAARVQTRVWSCGIL
jgi:hypothetical protein